MERNYFKEWQAKEVSAEQLIPIVGYLYRDKNVLITFYDRSLVYKSVVDIVKIYESIYSNQKKRISFNHILLVLSALSKLSINRCKIDLGKLVEKHVTSNEDVILFLKKELQTSITKTLKKDAGTDIVLYGFGRIGRILARILVQRAGGGYDLNLRAIVVRKGKAENDLKKRASLLRRDSVHGAFRGVINVDEKKNKIYANGCEIDIIYADDPASVDYKKYGINNAILIDNTGVWRDQKGLRQHLNNEGIAKILLTAPGKDNIKNIVYGVNDDAIEDNDQIISAASCTTNAITPIIKVINDHFGIKYGHIETIHSYTNDQNLIDNYHKSPRRGRSAALNMVITQTGAAKAISKALPEMKDRLTGSAIRVPTPNVSLAILNLTLDKATTLNELNEYLYEISKLSEFKKQIDFSTSDEVVSSDFIGNHKAGIIDSKANIVEEKNCILYIWYDNEFGYSCQVHRIIQKISGKNFPSYPS